MSRSIVLVPSVIFICLVSKIGTISGEPCVPQRECEVGYYDNRMGFCVDRDIGRAHR